MPTLEDHAEAIPYLKPMMRVHSACLAILIAALALMVLAPWVALLLLVVLMIMIPITIVLMLLAAGNEIGVGYAVRHLLLYVLLLPIGLLGPIVVPFMVWSDLTKRRAAEVQLQVIEAAARSAPNALR